LRSTGAAFAADVGAAQHAQRQRGGAIAGHVAALGRHVQQVALRLHGAQEAHQGAFRHPHHGGQLRQGQRLRGFAEVFQHGQRPQAADVLAGFAVAGFRCFVGAGFDPGGGVVVAREGLAAVSARVRVI
jgi:hypothetical protein